MSQPDAAVIAAWLKPALGFLAQQRQPLLFGANSPHPNSSMSLPGPSHDEEWSCAATSLTERSTVRSHAAASTSIGIYWKCCDVLGEQFWATLYRRAMSALEHVTHQHVAMGYLLWPQQDPVVLSKLLHGVEVRLDQLSNQARVGASSCALMCPASPTSLMRKYGKTGKSLYIIIHHLYTGIFPLPGFIDLQGENTLDALNGLERI